ncbi:MAG: glycosyltransferase, partial [Proteobacteria bacterium]|nr:glycosyltransferase [Pseudomonadota bacterium]
MPRLSVIVIALNQEANIADCLKSVSFADEIVVVDTGSTDRTVELARTFTDRVLTA